jgi:polar amino acid transport system substrate-binding protein
MRRITLALGVAITLTALCVTMLGTAQSATPKYGKCKPTGKFGSHPLKETVKDDTLVVGYVTIAPRTWKGNTPASVNDGYNYCFAANIAYRAGLSKIELKKVDFAQLVTGRLKGFDIAMDDIYIKPEREAKIDFSIPYGASWTGISGRTDDPVTKSKLKDLKFAVTLGSVQQQWVENVLKANQKPNTYDDTVELFAALRAKQVDAVAIDMPVSLPAAAASGGAVKVFGQVKVGGQVGIVMEQGTPNRKAINAIVKEVKANGTLHALEKKYYFASYGGVDPNKLPLWG